MPGMFSMMRFLPQTAVVVVPEARSMPTPIAPCWEIGASAGFFGREAKHGHDGNLVVHHDTNVGKRP